jgi:divalent metal cation (Fe/Co/Zn/Cd) transporter
MLIDACNGECIDISSSVKQITEEFKEVNFAHIVRLRKSGPVYQGEIEVDVSEDMTIKEFNQLKKKIKERIKSIFPEVERVTITAISKDGIKKEEKE